MKVTFSQGYLQILFEAWQQSSLTGCAPAALVAAWPSFALYGESTAQYWNSCGEAVCRGCVMVLVVMCVVCRLGGLGRKPCNLHWLMQFLLNKSSLVRSVD